MPPAPSSLARLTAALRHAGARQVAGDLGRLPHRRPALLDQKLGAPWLEGMPRDHLVAQLTNFRSGLRANDSHAQMRNMARSMTTVEIADVAAFDARDSTR
jgi:hypothetical protein